MFKYEEFVTLFPAKQMYCKIAFPSEVAPVGVFTLPIVNNKQDSEPLLLVEKDELPEV